MFVGLMVVTNKLVPPIIMAPPVSSETIFVSKTIDIRDYGSI